MAETALHRYRGRDFTRADIGFIAELIEAHPQAFRDPDGQLFPTHEIDAAFIHRRLRPHPRPAT